MTLDVNASIRAKDAELKKNSADLTAFFKDVLKGSHLIEQLGKTGVSQSFTNTICYMGAEKHLLTFLERKSAVTDAKLKRDFIEKYTGQETVYDIFTLNLEKRRLVENGFEYLELTLRNINLGQWGESDFSRYYIRGSRVDEGESKKELVSLTSAIQDTLFIDAGNVYDAKTFTFEPHLGLELKQVTVENLETCFTKYYLNPLLAKTL